MVVDLDQDDVAAGVVLVEAVAGDPQPVLGDLAEPIRPKIRPATAVHSSSFHGAASAICCLRFDTRVPARMRAKRL